MSDANTGSNELVPMTFNKELPENIGQVPSAFDKNTNYEVVFAKPVTAAGFKYGPQNGRILMKGGVLARIREEFGADVFASAVAR